MSLEIPITIANVVAITYSERIPAYLDAIETFVFVGTPTDSDINGGLNNAQR